MASVLEHEHQRETTLAPQGNGTQAEPRLRRLSVAEYDRMIEVGIFDIADRIELLEGVLIEMSPKGTKHSSSNNRAARYFIRLLGERAIVRAQDPVWLDDYSEPEPDLVVAAPDELEYAERHPRPQDIYLLAEIADTTINFDRSRKLSAYAKNGIRHYLIINVNRREIEDYREPETDGYRFKKVYTAEESFRLVAFPELEINVRDLLPPVKETDVREDEQPRATKTRNKRERTTK